MAESHVTTLLSKERGQTTLESFVIAFRELDNEANKLNNGFITQISDQVIRTGNVWFIARTITTCG